MRKNFLPTISMTNSLSDFFNSFDYMLHDYNSPDRYRSISLNTPRANIIKGSHGHTIEMAAPGYSRDDFQLDINNKVLTISVSSEDTQSYKDSIQVREYCLDTWTRSWVLPEGSNVEQISARYDAGILYIEIPNEMKMESNRSITVE